MLEEVDVVYEGVMLSLEATGILMQETEPVVTTLVDAHNGFNSPSRLAILWTVRHRWTATARFAFNFYKHWAQMIIRRTGISPDTLLS